MEEEEEGLLTKSTVKHYQKGFNEVSENHPQKDDKITIKQTDSKILVNQAESNTQ